MHCVHGQSRSAAVIISFLIYHQRRSLSGAMETLRLARPSICINPGFLSQLHLISSQPGPEGANKEGNFSAEYRLLFGASSVPPGPSKASLPQESLKRRRKGSIRCRGCGYFLLTEAEVLSIDRHKSGGDFLTRHVDPYWSNYRSIPQISDSGSPAMPLSLARRDLLCFSPSPSSHLWLLQIQSEKELRKTEGELTCPGCHSTCGLWRSKGLLVCHDFIRTDLFALQRTAIREII